MLGASLQFKKKKEYPPPPGCMPIPIVISITIKLVLPQSQFNNSRDRRDVTALATQVRMM